MCVSNISNCSLMMMWRHWFCAGLHDALLDTNLNPASNSFFQRRRRTATRTGWVSLRGHLGALLLSASSEIPRLCTCPCFRIWQIFFCWCVFPCCLCLLPVLRHNILLSNCRPILGIEWLSRHQQPHQWSESINWVLWFWGFFFSM